MRQMKTMLAIAAATILTALAPLTALAQGNIHERSTQYEWPKDEQVVNNLKQWQDLKFGVLIHWGLVVYLRRGVDHARQHLHLSGIHGLVLRTGR